MLKYKHIEAAREVRLWVGQIVLPVAGVLLAFPEAREKVREKYVEAKDFVSRKIKRP